MSGAGRAAAAAPGRRLRERRTAAAVAVMCLAVCVWAWWELPAILLDPWRVNDDQRQWAAIWHGRYDPGTLQGEDALLAFQAELTPKGYAALVRGLCTIAPPLAATKWLGALLLVGTVGLLARLGYERGGWTGACVAGTLAACGDVFVARTAGGVPRAFAFPLVCAALLLAGRGRIGAVAWLSVLGALLYPPVMAIVAVMYVLLLLARTRHPAARPALYRAALHGVAAGVCALAAVHDVGNFDDRVTFAEAERMPSLHAGGRYEILPFPSPLNEVAAAVTRGLWAGDAARGGGVGAAVLLGLAGAWVAGRGWDRAETRALVLLPAAGLLLYALARSIPFALFLPDRYVRYALPPAVVVGWTAVATGVGRRIARGPGGELAAVVLALVGAGLAGGVARPGATAFMIDGAPLEPLWRAVRGTPPDAVVSGSPTLMDDVLAFGHRRVFVSYELAKPLESRAHYTEMRRRLRRHYAAYYAETPAPVLALRDEEGVDYLLVDRLDYEPSRLARAALFPPVSAEIREIIAANRTGAFWLAQAPQHLVAAEVGQYRLLDLRRLPSADP